MQKLILIFIAFFALTLQAQQWVDIRFDENIRAKLPPNNWRVDSLEGLNWVGQDTACGFLISKRTFTEEAVQQTVIRTEEHLNGYYGGVLDGIRKREGQTLFKLVDNEIFEWKGLLLLKYHLQGASGGQELSQVAWHLLLDESMYIFACNTTISLLKEPRYAFERDMFFNGISLEPGITRDDQYMVSGMYYKIGEAVGRYLPHLIVGLVIAIVIILSRRKKKREAQSQAPTTEG